MLAEMRIIMVESKYTKMRVNNEIELCEVYEREIKDKVEKAFVKSGVSFFIKWKREQGGKGKYIICVNQYQKQRAEAAIHGIVDDVNEEVTFVEGRNRKGIFFRRLFGENRIKPLALLSKM